MANETQLANPSKTHKRKRAPHKKGTFKSKKKKNMRMAPAMGRQKVRIDKKMKKLFRKRAREYNSDESEEEERDKKGDQIEGTKGYPSDGENDHDDGVNAGGNGDDDDGSEMGSDDEGDEVQPGITMFVEGCKAFRVAFSKIMKIHVDDESLGPILSANKKLVATKLAEEEEEKKVKGEAKKAKHLIAEKGHVKPANFLDSQEKFLISVATKGVVKLFNAINKAQHAVKKTDSTYKNEKASRKRRYQVFFSELKKSQSGDAGGKAFVPSSQADKGQPSWAPLRDNYLLTDSKLKNWDKMAEGADNEDAGRIGGYGSDDDDGD
ncbi:hypothetical protein Droror1_Dr00002952 [Drosera rotundifolia]